MNNKQFNQKEDPILQYIHNQGVVNRRIIIFTAVIASLYLVISKFL